MSYPINIAVVFHAGQDTIAHWGPCRAACENIGMSFHSMPKWAEWNCNNSIRWCNTCMPPKRTRDPLDEWAETYRDDTPEEDYDDGAPE